MQLISKYAKFEFSVEYVNQNKCKNIKIISHAFKKVIFILKY